MTEVAFTVEGNPVPKQSFRYSSTGGYTAHNVRDWQNIVSFAAKQAMLGRPPMTCAVMVCMVFYLKDKRRVDLDNLAKGVNDGMRGIVFMDDSQIVHLDLVKSITNRPCVYVNVTDGEQK
jgi:Holliday junction resolvase RusA-like endonuclease